MSNEAVWVSRVMTDTTLIKFFRADVYLTDQDQAIDTIKRNDRGEFLPRELFPKEMYGMYADMRHKRQPDICNPSGFWTVSVETMSFVSGSTLTVADAVAVMRLICSNVRPSSSSMTR